MTGRFTYIGRRGTTARDYAINNGRAKGMITKLEDERNESDHIQIILTTKIKTERKQEYYNFNKQENLDEMKIKKDIFKERVKKKIEKLYWEEFESKTKILEINTLIKKTAIVLGINKLLSNVTQKDRRYETIKKELNKWLKNFKKYNKVENR